MEQMEESRMEKEEYNNEKIMYPTSYLVSYRTSFQKDGDTPVSYVVNKWYLKERCIFLIFGNERGPNKVKYETLIIPISRLQYFSSIQIQEK